MRIHRIYQQAELTVGEQLTLSPDASHHLMQVLRVSSEQELELFNGDNHCYQAKIITLSKKHVVVHIISKILANHESKLNIHLGQVISRGDRMDLTIQKAVELGVSCITPLTSERCGVKLDAKRAKKRHEHWQKIIISACEQSGRNVLPELMPVQSLVTWLSDKNSALRIMMDCHDDLAAKASLPASRPGQPVQILVGSEGGFSAAEKQLAYQEDFKTLLLGPRVLRTETAALALVAVLQARWGDFQL